MRILTLLAAIVCPTAAVAALSSPQGHPHFDDGGALAWQTKLDAAKAAAKAADKLILVEYGRAA